jgi:hypothetical protein
MGQEVGTNDFRISQAFNDGDCAFDVFTPDVTWNPDKNEYLVVWQGQNMKIGSNNSSFEIFGQLLNASGVEIGTNDFRISDVGGDDTRQQIPENDFRARDPEVIYVDGLDIYLVAFCADDNTGTLVNNEQEVFVQVLDGSGVEIGTNDMRITDMGPDTDADFEAFAPAMALNPITGQIMVVYHAHDNASGQHADETEIYLQRLGTAPVTANNDCSQSDLNVTTSLINSGDVIYRASNSIISDATLTDLTSFFFTAPTEINLGAGFTVPLNAQFIINMGPCN